MTVGGKPCYGAFITSDSKVLFMTVGAKSCYGAFINSDSVCKCSLWQLAISTCFGAFITSDSKV